jgi:hypothetical protein
MTLRATIIGILSALVLLFAAIAAANVGFVCLILFIDHGSGSVVPVFPLYVAPGFSMLAAAAVYLILGKRAPLSAASCLAAACLSLATLFCALLALRLT